MPFLYGYVFKISAPIGSVNFSIYNIDLEIPPHYIDQNEIFVEMLKILLHIDYYQNIQFEKIYHYQLLKVFIETIPLIATQF